MLLPKTPLRVKPSEMYAADLLTTSMLRVTHGKSSLSGVPEAGARELVHHGRPGTE